MPHSKTTHYRWVVIALLFFITLVNYIDRASIAYAIDHIANTFHLNDTEIGLVLGAFGVGYVITTFLGGILVDHYGTKITLSIAVVFWAGALMITGAATGFASLFFARVLLGVAEGPNFPGLTRVVSDWLSIKERTRALSYALIAVPVGLAIGAPLISALITHYSWRVMFYCLAALSCIWLPFWVYLFQNSPEKSKYVNQQELTAIHTGDHAPDSNTTAHSSEHRKHIKGLWRFLFTNPTLLTNYWAFFVFGYYLFFFMGWLPTYLFQSYHLNVKNIGLFSILPWTFGAIFMWVAGSLSDRIYIKTGNYRQSRTQLIWTTQLLSAACIIPIILFHSLTVTIIFISLAVGFILSANGAYYAVNIDIAKERAGTALGIMDATFALSGFLSPVLTGWTVTITGDFMAAFIILTLLALSSVILLFIFHRPDAKGNHLIQNHSTF